MHDDVVPQIPDGDGEPLPKAVEVVMVDHLDIEPTDATSDSSGMSAALARSIGETAMLLTLRSASAGISAGRALFRAASKRGPAGS